MIKVRKNVVVVIALAVIVIAGSLGMWAGDGGPMDAVLCITASIGDRKSVV